MASIDHFPTAWSYIRKRKLTATRDWLLRQKQTAVFQILGDSEKQIAEKISLVFKANGLKPQITESKSEFLCRRRKRREGFFKN